MHDVGVVGVPILVILFAAYWNNKRIDRLEDKVDTLGPRVVAKIDSLRSEMQQEFREFYKTWLSTMLASTISKDPKPNREFAR